MNKRTVVSGSILGVGAIIATLFFLSSNPDNAGQSGESDKSQVFVGGDLHALNAFGDRLYISGHAGAGMSSDGGVSWKDISTLKNTDAMGWSKTSNKFLVGGHPGLFQSTDEGSTFKKINFYGDVSDVHSIGASGDTVYLASPQIGLLASTDGGVKWLLRNAQVGQSFMGSMLVDPTNPLRVIAPDMQNGLVTSRDGGVSWKSLGAAMGAMSVTWNPMNIEEIAGIGMNGGAISNDGGSTWKELPLPAGSSVVAYSGDGQKLYSAVLIGVNATIFVTKDAGKNWKAVSASSSSSERASTMDPDMSGMDHGETATEDDHGETATEDDLGDAPLTQRPLKATLSVFGFGTLLVLFGATALRRKDRRLAAAKKAARVGIGAKK